MQVNITKEVTSLELYQTEQAFLADLNEFPDQFTSDYKNIVRMSLRGQIDF